MWTPILILLAVLVVLACASLGAGVYEFLVVDPVWPHRPAIIQSRNGGLSRRRFWIPAYLALEVVLIVAVLTTWGEPPVRTALLVGAASHVVMRAWSLVDLAPKAATFEKADPAVVERAEATRWTRRNMLRAPLDVITCAAVLTAFVAAT